MNRVKVSRDRHWTIGCWAGTGVVMVVGKACGQVGEYFILILFSFCFIIFRLIECKTHKCTRVFLLGGVFISRPIVAQHRKREHEQIALFNVM